MRNGQLGAYRARKAYELYKMTTKDSKVWTSDYDGVTLFTEFLSKLYMYAVDGTYLYCFTVATGLTNATLLWKQAHGIAIGGGVYLATDEYGTDVVIGENVGLGSASGFTVDSPSSASAVLTLVGTSTALYESGTFRGAKMYSLGTGNYDLYLLDSNTPKIYSYQKRSGVGAIYGASIGTFNPGTTYTIPLSPEAFRDFTISADGKNVYILDSTGEYIYKLSCATAFDFANLKFDTKFPVPSTYGALRSIDISSDGKYLTCNVDTTICIVYQIALV